MAGYAEPQGDATGRREPPYLTTPWNAHVAYRRRRPECSILGNRSCRSPSLGSPDPALGRCARGGRPPGGRGPGQDDRGPSAGLSGHRLLVAWRRILASGDHPAGDDLRRRSTTRSETCTMPGVSRIDLVCLPRTVPALRALFPLSPSNGDSFRRTREGALFLPRGFPGWRSASINGRPATCGLSGSMFSPRVEAQCDAAA